MQEWANTCMQTWPSHTYDSNHNWAYDWLEMVMITWWIKGRNEQERGTMILFTSHDLIRQRRDIWTYLCSLWESRSDSSLWLQIRGTEIWVQHPNSWNVAVIRVWVSSLMSLFLSLFSLCGFQCSNQEVHLDATWRIVEYLKMFFYARILWGHHLSI